MDHRSKNRHREHADHGWIIEVPAGENNLRPFQELRRCPCGWAGWIDPAE